MTEDVALDLYCGLGGWAEGLLSEGFSCIGFDIERHDYGTGGYPGQLVLQDVLTLCGAQFRAIAERIRVIVASPPCTEPSYRAMPWKRAKALNAAGPPVNFIKLFEACFRIQRELSEVAGRHIPLIVENVKGAQPWVGRAQAHFGSYYLWGDVGQVGNRVVVLNGRVGSDKGIRPQRGQQKCPGFDGSGKSFQSESVKVSGQNWSRHAKTGEVSPHWRMEAVKNEGHLNIRDGHSHTRHLTNPAEHIGGVKGFTPDGQPLGKNELGRKWGSKSPKRKQASAMIAKIPFPLAQHIARCFSSRNTATS